jgi:hypothetical protein
METLPEKEHENEASARCWFDVGYATSCFWTSEAGRIESRYGIR